MEESKLTKIDNGQGCEKSLDSGATFSLSSKEMEPDTIYKMPWLDSSGKALSEDQLRLMSKTWDSETWARYLKYFEPIQKEKLVSVGRFQKELNRNPENIFLRASSGSPIETSRLKHLLDGLTERQRQVIEMNFWRSMSQREIARALKLSQSTVAEIKAAAIKKLRELVEMDPVTLPICIEPARQDETKEEQNVKTSA